MKKNSNLQELMGYAGGHRYLTYLSLLLSAISAILALFPFVFLFRIIQEVIAVAPNYTQATHIVRNGWMAVGFAVLSIVIYVCALMCSHLSAFRIAGNIRKALMAHIAELPLGFIGETGSGKIRRIVSDSSAATETYLAHQLPDMSAAVTTPVCMIVMLFLFDWRFGLVSLLPVILGFAAMFKMAGPSMAEDMELYQNALADMNNEAVEYVRGVPVVKTFGQTVHSFKRFKGTIDSYYEFVMSYCKKCRPSMLSYTVLVGLMGFYPMEEAYTLNQPGTRFPSHTDRKLTPGVDLTTGSLGQGVSTATGAALGNKIDGRDSYVYCVIGDGEADEGQVWEGFHFAYAHKLDNIIYFVDNNGYQLDGPTGDILAHGDMAKKVAGFGLHVQEIDGHDVKAIYEAIQKAKETKGVPSCIVLNTSKGKGATFAEPKHDHSSQPKEEQWLEAIAASEKELEAAKNA